MSSDKSLMLSDITIWQTIFPEFHITDSVFTAESAAYELPKSDHDIQTLFKKEGYFQIDSIITKSDIEKLASGFCKLKAQGIHPIFAFMYDEYWRIVKRLMPVLKSVLGDNTMLLPDIWTWFIEKGDQNTGWPIHRDLLNLQETKSGEPNMITLWIPLVDVDPYNSCIYLVPKHLDKNYPDNLKAMDFSPENVRAISLPAGSLVAWSANMLHWGSRSTPYAKKDRLSMAFYLQREGIPMNHPVIKFDDTFSFQHRLRYIATQIVDYSRDNFAPYVMQWAKENRFKEENIKKDFY